MSARPAAASPASKAIEGTVQKLRSELANQREKPRQARLLGEIGELEERVGDEPAAARDYLAAFNTDPQFREPLEGLVRLLERRRSLRNLGKLIDALVRAAETPEEKARSLLMKAAFEEDSNGNAAGAKDIAREVFATGAEGPEKALAWLMLEVLGGKLGEPLQRAEALLERGRMPGDPTWRGLLLLDAAKIAAGSGDVGQAIALVDEARKLRGAVGFEATMLAARFIRADPGVPGSPEAEARARAYAATLEAQADLIHFATTDPSGGDAVGVPRWARSTSMMVDAWMRAADAHRATGEIAAAAHVLDRAERALEGTPDGESGLVRTTLMNQRLRVADMMGDLAASARLAESRIGKEEDAGLAAALGLRIAEDALRTGDTARALDALSKAISRDPGNLPARALQLDVLADGDDPAAFATELESFAEYLDTDEARGRTFLLSAFVWGMLAGDVEAARAAISQAGLYGVPPSSLSRLSRAMAAYCADVTWHDEATRRLIASGADASELRALWFELARGRFARNDDDGAAKAIRELGSAPNGAWLARTLETFLPPCPSLDARRKVALDELATMEAAGTAEPSAEADPERAGGRARGLAIASAARAHHEGDVETARARLRILLASHPKSALVACYLADLDRAAGAPADAAAAALASAEATEDPELAASLRLEAGFDKWRAGDRQGAVDAFENAAVGAPDVAKNALSWASRGLGTGSLEGRRRAIQRAIDAGEDPHVLGLERFAVELAAGAFDDAARALDTIGQEADNNLLTAGDLARIAWDADGADLDALRTSIGRIGALAPSLAAAEQFRVARTADPGAVGDTARAWFDAGGGMTSALEWLAATLGGPDEVEARRQASSLFEGPARGAMLASASLLDHLVASEAGEIHFVEGDSPAVRLANLELARPGGNLKRRAKALVALDGALGPDIEIDALGLAGWSLLASGDTENALRAFHNATKAKPNEIAPWVGLHATAEAASDVATRARAAESLGLLSLDPRRAAAFLEESALLLLDAGEGDHAEELLQASFDRDPSRGVAFDKLFRRVREKKDGERLLGLIEKRLEATDNGAEIVKLYWERARVLRENGDADGALVALENVTIVEPDHVGALALCGEIFIRKGRYEEAAESLGRLAKVEAAPPKNRVTAGIAAVDLYENKLQRFDLALDVLLTLHRAKLTSMPVRERLARAAARSGAWAEAASILEELMNDRPTPEGCAEAAQLAMAIHRDRLEDPNGAMRAIIKLLGLSPNHGDAIDLLLVTDSDPEAKKNLLVAARRALVDSLADAPLGGVVVRRVANVAAALGDEPLEHAALAAAAALGGGGDDARLRVTQLANRAPRVPQTALTDSLRASLAAPGDDGPVAELFAVLGPTLAEALGPTLAAAGVGKRDRVEARSGLPLRNEIAAWAGAFGVLEFELYVGGRDAAIVQGIPGEPGAIVVGPGVNSPLHVHVRAQVARELYAISRGTTIVRLRDETAVAAVVIAACKIAEVRIEAPNYAVQAEIDKAVAKAIPRRTKKLLPEICQRIAASRADARVWSRRALASLDRVAVLACGDVGFVLGEALGQPVDQVAEHVRGDARAEELLRFAMSPLYIELRQALGLEGKP
jgi:tetratricopeptide (TPR) repeat protein